MKAMILGVALVATAAPGVSQEASYSLVGSWHLVSFVQHFADGTSRPNRVTIGHLIYTAEGRMCAVLMAPDRPQWTGATPYTATPSDPEAVGAAKGFDAYCSRVEVDTERGIVMHYVESSFKPNLVGRVRRRAFSFEGPDRLILKPDPSELALPVVANVLTWQRDK